MKESLNGILQSIQNHIKSENANSVKNKAIGRGKVQIGGGDKQIWITNREIKSSYNLYYDRNYVVHGESKGKDTLTDDGLVTSKNSPWGRAILYNKFGQNSVNAPARIINFILDNRSTYISQNGDAIHLRVDMAEEGIVNYASLTEALNKYVSAVDSTIELKRKAEEAERERLRLEKLAQEREKERLAELKRIQDEEEKRRIEEKHRKEEEEHNRKILEQQLLAAKAERERKELEDKLANELEKYSQAASFIRRQASLRLNPVLDKVQDEIKFSNLFNGVTTIINGGPGTGKTTTLIQRLKLMICKVDLEEYVKLGICSLTPKQMEIIEENGGNWMFFSPTELLKVYLKENMNSEGLQDTTNKVQVWDTYLARIVRDKYHLVGDNAPFGFKRREFENTIAIIDKELSLIDDFLSFFVETLKSKLMDITRMDMGSYSWKTIGKNISDLCKSANNAKSLRDVVLLLMRLERYRNDKLNGKDSLAEMVSQYYSDIKDMAAEYMVKWQKDKDLYAKLKDIYEDNYEDDYSEDDDDETFSIASVDNKIASDLRHLLRLLVLRDVQNVEITGRKAKIFSVVGSKINTEPLKRLSDIAVLNASVMPVVSGYEMIFDVLPKAYKEFRKKELETNNDKRWNLKLLNKIINSYSNRPLHPQEQALLLGIINNIILMVRSISVDRFISLKHKYAKAYKEVVVPVIGIDEATDYCLLDFYAINSLRHYEVSSITMTGDGMQCLKENGVFDWKILSDKRLFEKGEVKDLKISYRQSKELLSLAHSLYRKALHKIAPYHSYLETMDNVPKPLWYETDDDEKKAKWIIQRILEIKNNYGFVPSIAIFVTDSKDAQNLFDYLDDNGKLDEAGICVKNCVEGDKLSDSDAVRIFPIDKVKGMEFEVVFFHNIDKVKTMVDRYLYVGLSRATFYLGVTSNEVDDEALLTIQRMFNKRGNWATINDGLDVSEAQVTTDNESKEEKIIKLMLKTENTILTKDIIELAKTPNGGITRSQLEAVGLTWPPVENWKEQAEGKELTPSMLKQFLTVKYAKRKQ